MKAGTFLATLAAGMAAASIYAQGGPPPGGGPGFRGPGGPGGGMNRGLPPVEMLVFRHDVQDDIQLTDAQRSKLDAIRDTMRPSRGPGGPGGQGGQGGPPPGGPGFGGPPQGGPGFDGQDGPPPQDGRGPGGGQMDERRKQNEAAIKAILTNQQFNRVKGIGIQLAGARAILDKNVQGQLGLSEDQRSSVTALVKAEQESMRAQFDQMRHGGNGDPQQMRETMDKNRKAFGAKLKAVLTSDQAAQLKTMGGKPFKSETGDRFGGPPPPPRGGG